MPSNIISSDADAVTAVLRGDRERFRELVERYEDKVFAITWSRLGDRSMAEDAAQETFIHAYRRLALLGGAEKFGSWITKIARNTAINLGMRNRSELSKRERWALESADETAVHPEGDPACATETLRDSMAELPAIHRECLVLFYLENRSVSEAAALLMLSETAFKTRLHRARQALRAILESHLEASLENLRPSAQFASAVMLAVPAGKPSLATLGGLGLLAKVFPSFAGWLCLAAPLAFLPLDRWVARKTAENYRDQEGFRARDFRAQSGKIFRWIVVGALGSIAVAVAIHLAFIWTGMTNWAPNSHGQRLNLLTPVAVGRGFCAVIALFYGIWIARRWRSVLFTRHRFIVAEWFAQASIVAGFAALALGAKMSVLFFALAGHLFFTGIGTSAQPLRMDYSLFLRAIRGLLKTDLTSAVAARTFSSETLSAFARFLGQRLLARDWQPHPQGLELLLNTPGLGIATIWYSWKVGHTLILRHDGVVTAHLTDLGLRGLSQTAPVTEAERPALEATVASAVRAALTHFAEGDVTAAESALGEQAANHVFVQSPATAAGMRWRAAGCFLLAAAFIYFATF